MITKKDLELINSLRSSYKQENLGWTFYALAQSLVKKDNPMCVELGCLEGYSSSFIAHALNDLDKGHLWVMDYFSNPQLSSGWTHAQSVQTKVYDLLLQQKIQHRVTLMQGDAFDIPQWPILKDQKIDFLHIDVGNTFSVLANVWRAWQHFIADDAIIIIEGGSLEREAVGWMPRGQEIFEWLGDMRKNGWVHTVVGQMPSLTILRNCIV